MEPVEDHERRLRAQSDAGRIALWIVGAVAAAVAMLVALAALCRRVEPAAPTVTAAVDAARPAVPMRRRELQRIALLRTPRGLIVCPSERLTGCTLRYGLREEGGLRRERMAGPTLIAAVSDCDAVVGSAVSECLRSDAEPRACMGEHGVFVFGSMPLRDVRDTELQPGYVELQCDQGFKAGHFTDD